MAGEHREELLGGGEDLFVSPSHQGNLLPALAPEDGAPGAPVLFRVENYQPLLALFASKDNLFGRTMHVYPLRPSWELCLVVLASLQVARGPTSHILGTDTR